MKGLKSLRLFKWVTLLFSAVHLFYALTNIYFLPRSLPFSSAPSAFSGIRARRNSVDNNHHAINFSRMADRCFLEENQPDSTKFIAVLLVTFFSSMLFATRQIFPFVYKRLFYHQQYSFLALRAIRI
jgi:hypothetical protein